MTIEIVLRYSDAAEHAGFQIPKNVSPPYRHFRTPQEVAPYTTVRLLANNLI